MGESTHALRHGSAAPGKTFLGCGCLGWTIAVILLLLFAGVGLGPINRPLRHPASGAIQTTHTLVLAMFAYANDHDGQYPDGKTSTEVFQKLVDEKYVSDPGIFFLKMPDKVKAESSQRLKPENVCFDLITPVDSNTPDNLPVVFSTGYRVDITAGGAAMPRRITGWFDSPRPLSPDWGQGNDGIAVAYKNNGSGFVHLQPADPAHPQGSIPEFIPKDIDFQGRVYRQLTPEGTLP